MFTFSCRSVFTVNNSYLYNICHFFTYFDPNVCLSRAKILLLSHVQIHAHSLTHDPPVSSYMCTSCHRHTRLEGKRGLSPEGLCAVEGLEDSGYLKHDRTRLWVVHPLGAVQRILQHVFKCCTHRRKHTHPHRGEANSIYQIRCKDWSVLNKSACTQQRLWIGQAQLDNRVLQDGLEQWAVCVDAFVHIFWRRFPVSQQPFALQAKQYFSYTFATLKMTQVTRSDINLPHVFHSSAFNSLLLINISIQSTQSVTLYKSVK